MKNKLTDNLGLKILAVVLSAFLWLIAININDPVSQNSYNVNVQLLNLSGLTTAGKYVEVLNSSDEIRVTVRGTRTALSAFSSDDIVATADVTKITEDNQVPIEITTTRISDKIESVKSDSKFVELAMENISKFQMPIDVIVQNEPADGYILGNTVTSQNVVIVSGPESVVSDVDYAAVEINVDDATSDVKIALPLHLYSEEGRIVESPKITMSISEVTATATVLQTATIPVRCAIVGEPLDGYVLNGSIEGMPESITIAGRSNVINGISEINVTDALDVTGCYASASFSVILNDYLPDGVTIVGDSDNGLVNVTVGIEKEETRVIELPPEKIHITGVPNGYQVEMEDTEDNIEISISGLGSTIRALDKESLIGILDVDKYLSQSDTTLQTGHIDVPLSVTLPNDIKLKKEVKVRLSVKKD